MIFRIPMDPAYSSDAGSVLRNPDSYESTTENLNNFY